MELLDQASELPPGEQSAYLDSACEDEEIRREVEELLAAGQKESFLDHRPALALALPTEQLSWAGPYRLERVIGQGGMGIVYLGMRSDDEYQRQVAIKVLPHAIALEDQRLRFRTERQLLAQLEHPNIARLYDGGTAEAGQPYLVMEYVEGVRIDDFCQGLPVEERLRLFQLVCAAVAYAHGHLVIHRDIKPGNILVTTEGIPKLLDFGIAKSLDPKAAFATRTGMAPLTPAYASPEQMSGGELTTASDIYSLGVVLYELLTGKRPAEERDDEPTRPSIAAERHDSELARRLSGDLDAILLKALRKEPEQRYVTVQALSEDIGRHLDHLPVQARAGALSYSLGKLYRRNRAAVHMAAILMVTLVFFVLALFRQTRIAMGLTQVAETERASAERERDRATRALNFMVSAFKVSDPDQIQGDQVTARQILDAGADKVREELEGEPEMQATLFAAMGEVYVSLGLFETAEGLHHEALELRRGTDDEALSIYQLAELEWSRRDYQAAETLYRDALAQFQNGTIEHAQALRGLGLVLVWLSKDEEAERILHVALDTLGDYFNDDHDEILRIKYGLGRLAREKGDYETAEQLLREVVAVRQPRGARPSLGHVLAELGAVRGLQGNLEEARALLEEALPMLRMGGETSYVGEALGKLNLVLTRLGDDTAAEAVTRERLTIPPKDHPGKGIAFHNLALILGNRGQFEEAEDAALESLHRNRIAFGETSKEVALSSCLLGWIALGQTEPKEARAHYEYCGSIMKKILPADHPQLAFAWLGIGRSARALEGCAAALKWHQRAYALRLKTLGLGHHLTAQAGGYLGECLSQLGRDRDAEKLLTESLQMLLDQDFAKGDRRVCEAAERLAAFYRARGEEEKLHEAAIPSCQ